MPSYCKSYPAVYLIAEYGSYIAVFLALVLPALSIWAWTVGYSALVLGFGLVAGCLVYGIVKSYAELVHIISDMLLPK